MATRRKKKVSKKPSFAKDAAIVGIKMVGGGAMGATLGAIKATQGETAATVTRGALGLAGMAGELLLDEDASPVLKSISRAAMYGVSTLVGHEFGENQANRFMDAKREREVQEMEKRVRDKIQEHTEDLEEKIDKIEELATNRDFAEHEAAEVTVKKGRKKAGA